MTARDIIEEVFTAPTAKNIWTANTTFLLPLTPQNFSVGSILPAVFYMCRRGCRRGKGRFQSTFSMSERYRANVFSVAAKLSQDTSSFKGFDFDVEKDILGDLILCDVLENKGHAEGHKEEILRAFPVHFFASWLDLPPTVAHLRFVPEMLVSILANQTAGLLLQPALSRAPFTVGQSPEQNLFFQVFARGVQFGENTADLRADVADENMDYSIEEYLMVRLAQECNEAPETSRTRHGAAFDIQNCWPISHRAAFMLRSDLTLFLERYGQTIPRRSITPMLETLLGLGLLMIYLESNSISVAWEKDGAIPDRTTQKPIPIFVDASNGSDSRLRDLSEQSFDELFRLLDQSITATAQIRILHALMWDDPDIQSAKPNGPDTSAWLNLLADVRNNKHDTSAIALRDLKIRINRMATMLETEGIEPDAIDILRSPSALQNPVRAVAEAICSMMGDKLLRQNPMKFLDSCLMVSDPHGIGRKRRVARSFAGQKRKMMDVRSVVLSNTLLETLVHLHLISPQRILSFADFLRILRENYGLWVDECPPGVSASREDLLNNRAMLERRLRDLGLLVGVNDAEFMKHLRPRFQSNNPA